MKYLLICSLLFAVGCTRNVGPTAEQLKELSFQSCVYGAVKTQVTLLEQGALIPETSDALLGKEPAETLCKELVDKYGAWDTAPNR
jgi:hypothetical protein